MVSSCWGLDTSSSIKFSFNCYIVCLWTYFRWDISYKLGPSSDEYSPRCNCGLGKLKFTPFQKNRGRGSRKICCCSFGQNIGNRLNIIFSKSACRPACGPGFGRSSKIRGYKIIQMYFSLGEGFGNQGDHRKIRESCLLQSGNLSAVLRILKEEPARHFTQQSLSISVHVQHCLSSEGEFIRSTKSTEGRAGEKFQEGFSAILPFSDSSTSTC